MQGHTAITSWLCVRPIFIQARIRCASLDAPGSQLVQAKKIKREKNKRWQKNNDTDNRAREYETVN
jgi:hypothetical protein